MFHSFIHHQVSSISRWVAWSSLASLTLVVGCVEATTPPASVDSSTQVEVAPGELGRAVPTLAESTTVDELSPTLAEPIPATGAPAEVIATPSDSDNSWATSTPIITQPQLAENANSPAIPPEPIPAHAPGEAEPTPVEETPSLSSTPGGLTASPVDPSPSEAAPAPFPADGEPALASVDSPLAEPQNQPPVVAQAGKPVPNANANPIVDPKPLDLEKPRSLIHISPRSLTPASKSTATPGEPTGQQTSNAPPAVVLPASPLADAAALAPLAPSSPLPAAPASTSAEPASTLVSSDVKVPEPTLPTLTPPSTLSEPATVAKPPAGIPVATVSISSGEQSTPANTSPPEGFSPLFNNQDLTGWEVFDGKPTAWQFKDGMVSCVTPGGGWLQTLAMYSDFELQFEYRLSEGGNSGVALRFPGQGNPSLQGLEIQLLDDRAEKYHTIQPQQATGSLYFVAAPKVRDIARAAGEWNQCSIRCIGHQLQVSLNGLVVNEIDLSRLMAKEGGKAQPVSGTRSPMGTIALQSHSTRVDFRNMNLRDLTQPLASGVRWLDLQEGTGEPVPAGAKVTVHYIGHLSTGKRFANSVEKGKPATVLLKDVIPGWREGIPGMKVGGKRRLIVPAEMAYGKKGFKEVVPPNSTLVYEVDLTAFEQQTLPAATTEAVVPPSTQAQ